LYIGATLMVGASIYGFIDYKKSTNEKKFRTLYDNKEQAAVPTKEKELNSVREESVTTVAEAKEKTSPVPPVPEATPKKLNVGKKKKKITYKQFSRGRIDEKILKEEPKAEATKESPKVKKKEQ
jgi:hypothetical protein